MAHGNHSSPRRVSTYILASIRQSASRYWLKATRLSQGICSLWKPAGLGGKGQTEKTKQQCAFFQLGGRVRCLQRSQMSVTVPNTRQPTTHIRVINRQRKAK